MTHNTFNNLMRLPGIQAMLESAQAKAAKMSRLDDLVDVARFIEGASLLECKHIINSLVDRVSSLVGSASELEDASDALMKEINYEAHPAKHPCDECAAARSDEHHDRKRDGEMMMRAA
jgi:hypothetical protein